MNDNLPTSPYTGEAAGVGSHTSTEIVIDVLTLYMMEKQSGYPIAGRVLPAGYRWHRGDYVAHNYFRNNYDKPYTIWDWSWTGGY